MVDLKTELERARALDVDTLADAIEAIGFECTRCGACCRGHGGEHVATVFPGEVRAIRGTEQDTTDDTGDMIEGSAYDWRDVARPMPFGLAEDADGAPAGETFEWALQTGDCGDCTFYEHGPSGSEPGSRNDGVRSSDPAPDAGDDGTRNRGGRCTVYDDRPLICQTYPFSVELGESAPLGAVVDRVGSVRAHECEGLGRDIDRETALDLARTLKARAIREVEELIAVRDRYEPVDPDPGEVLVHDSEGVKRPDGSAYR